MKFLIKPLFIALVFMTTYSEIFCFGNLTWNNLEEAMNRYYRGQLDRACNTCKPLCCNTVPDLSDDRVHGTIKVGTDNNGNPINMAYAAQGKKGDPTIIFADNYFGINGMKCAQEALKKCYYTVAIDQIGFGLSSKPTPTAVDGVKGFPGYSYDQTTVFIHKFLSKLEVETPIIFVGVDFQGVVGMKYAVTYENDPFEISKLVLIVTSPAAIVSDDPCVASFLTTTQAAQLADFFEFDPCAASCALFAGSFADPECLEYGNKIYNEAVNNLAGVPPSVFRRLFTQTFAEDVSALMAQIEIPVLYLYGVIDQQDMLSRITSGMTFSGYCPPCGTPNLIVTGTCPCDTPFILPFTDIEFITFAGKGTGLWLTDHEKFFRALTDFITGCNRQCCPCPKVIGNPVICPLCPNT